MNTTFAKSETLLGVAFAPLDLVRQVGLVIGFSLILRASGDSDRASSDYRTNVRGPAHGRAARIASRRHGDDCLFDRRSKRSAVFCPGPFRTRDSIRTKRWLLDSVPGGGVYYRRVR